MEGDMLSKTGHKAVFLLRRVRWPQKLRLRSRRKAHPSFIVPSRQEIHRWPLLGWRSTVAEMVARLLRWSRGQFPTPLWIKVDFGVWA